MSVDERRVLTGYGAAAGVAFLGLIAVWAGPAGRVPGSLMLIAASAGSAGLAVWGPPLTVRWFRQRLLATYGLMAGFNLFLVFGILIEAVALVVLLFDAEPSLSPGTVRAMWLVPAFLAIFQTTVLLERRAGDAAFRPARNPAIVAAGLGLLGVITWANGLTAGATNLFFVTGQPLEAAQGIYLVLLGHLFVAVGAMVLYRIPAVFELLVNRPDELGRLRAVTSASPLFTSLLITGAIVLVALVAAAGRSRIPFLGQIVPAPIWAQLLMLVVVVLVAFLMTAGTLTVTRKRRKPLFRTKMEARQRAMLLVGTLSGLLAVLFLFLIVTLYTRPAIELGPISIGAEWRHEAVVAGILAVTGPAGFYLYREHRRDQFLEERLADFLADLAESSNAGLSLHGALQSARRKDYGPLNDEIALMANQVSWGVTFEEVFARFGDRSRSTLVKRTANLVVESSRSGGNTSDVLKAAAKDVFEIKALEGERRIAMTTYLIVIYVVFLVFLAILAVLSIAFIPPLLETTQAASGGTSRLFSGQRFDPASLKAAYFHAVLVQAMGNGAVAGVIRENRFSAGLRHVFFMVLIAYLVFKMLIL